MAKKRLTQADWKLICEALDMLAQDYPDGHDEIERIRAVHDFAQERGYSNKPVRVPPVPKRIKDAILGRK